MKHVGPLRFALGAALWATGMAGARGSWPQYVGEQRNVAGKTYRFDSSTTFFNWVMAAGVMNVTADFFHGIGSSTRTPP